MRWRLVVLAMAVGLAGAWTDARAQSASHRPHIETAATRFGLPADLIARVIDVESNGEARAVSPAGAMGLMQLMPGTWAMLRARLGLGDDPFDPRDNILAGSAYLRDLRDRYGVPGFLAAYNAGPGRYEQSLSGRPLPGETRRYLARFFAAGVVVAPAPTWRRAGLFPVPGDTGGGQAATPDASDHSPPSLFVRPGTVWR